jgi:hypothetical protein
MHTNKDSTAEFCGAVSAALAAIVPSPNSARVSRNVTFTCTRRQVKPPVPKMDIRYQNLDHGNAAQPSHTVH